MFNCVRVYNNGQIVTIHCDKEKEVKMWIDYNKKFRSGCALFVNGECKAVGYLGDVRCQEISNSLNQNCIV